MISSARVRVGKEGWDGGGQCICFKLEVYKVAD